MTQPDARTNEGTKEGRMLFPLTLKASRTWVYIAAMAYLVALRIAAVGFPSPVAGQIKTAHQPA